MVAPLGIEMRLVELRHVFGGDGVPCGLVGVSLLQDLREKWNRQSESNNSLVGKLIL